MTERTPLQPASGLARPTDRIPGPPSHRPRTSSVRTAEPEQDRPTLHLAEATSDREEKPATQPGAPTRRVPASRRSTGGTRETSISLPVSIRERLRTATTGGPSIAEVILTAVEATEPQLDELVSREQPPVPTSNGLFPDRAAQPSAAEPRTTAPLQTTAANLEVLDRLVRRTNARSRSQLITAALRAHLSGPS